MKGCARENGRMWDEFERHGDKTVRGDGVTEGPHLALSEELPTAVSQLSLLPSSLVSVCTHTPHRLLSASNLQHWSCCRRQSALKSSYVSAPDSPAVLFWGGKLCSTLLWDPWNTVEFFFVFPVKSNLLLCLRALDVCWVCVLRISASAACRWNKRAILLGKQFDLHLIYIGFNG